MESNENLINRIFEYTKTDNVESLKMLVSENADTKHFKLGNLPLLSVAVLFGAKNCADFLLPLFREINTYSEVDAPNELNDKLKGVISDFSSKYQNKNNSENKIENKDCGENSKETNALNETETLYKDARFIEPCEIAVLLSDFTLANEILSKVGIKSVSAKKRIETLLSQTNEYSLCGGENKFRINKTHGKSKNGLRSKWKKILIYCVCAMVIAVVVPVIVLASVRVKVTYYVDNVVYGKEEGIGGANITLQDPQKEGHTFIGWFTDKELSQNTQNKLPKKSTNLYAGWSVNTYTIIFDNDNYEFLNEFEKELSGKYGASLTFPVPKLDGKLFLGWFDESENIVTSNVYKKNLILKPKFADFESNSLDNPYEISEQTEFLYLCDQEGYFTIKDGLTLDNDFISSGMLCDHTKGFIGNFDGQERTLYFKGDMPLFLNISENGTVKNLNLIIQEDIKLNEYTVDRFGIVSAINSGTLENISINFAKTTSAGTVKNVELSSNWFLGYVGAIAGSNSGKVKSCYVDGNFEINIPSAYQNFCQMGGIVGANIGEIASSFFTAKVFVDIYNGGFGGLAGYNCGKIASSGTNGEINVDGITLTTNDYIDGYVTQVGGIVAVNASSKSSSGKVDSGEIQCCTNYADIKISNKNTELYVGGIASYNECVIVSSHNYGSIHIEKTDYVQYLGGIVGFTASRGQGSLKNCTNNASIETIQKGYAYQGGVAGYSISSDKNNKLQIENCINNGKISNGTQIGGIVGYAVYSELIDCINKGAVSTVVASVNDASKAVGGLVGGAMECAITSSYNHGNISVSNLKNFNVSNYVGGIIADNIDTVISLSANTSTLTYGENDVVGLVCGVMNSINGNAVIESTYAVKDNKTVSFYAYDSSQDSNGDFIDHVDGDKSKPKLYAENDGLVESKEEIENLLDKSLS